MSAELRPHATPRWHPALWTSQTLTLLRTRLLRWFEQHRRELPWRRSRDPYRIWVSEVMLQQTTVAAVVPYFERFLRAFPTVISLAAADEQDVLRLWEGLGYYRRARHLHAAAKRLVAAHPHHIPDDPDFWAELPGVGRYILGAVLSQAFDRRLPIVEANSLRVLSRLHGYQGDPRSGGGQRWVWAAAETLLPRKRAGDFNQALMELGALVCRPLQPACGACPWKSVCIANRESLQTVIPPVKPSPIPIVVREVGVVIRKGEALLLCQRRPDANRWQNLWEVPHAEIQSGESISDTACRVARELTGYRVRVAAERTKIQHTVTRHTITLTVVEAICTGGRFRSDFYTASRWIRPHELADYPTSAPQRKLLSLWSQ